MRDLSTAMQVTEASYNIDPSTDEPHDLHPASNHISLSACRQTYSIFGYRTFDTKHSKLKCRKRKIRNVHDRMMMDDICFVKCFE